MHFFTAVCNTEANAIDSPSEFLEARLVPIKKIRANGDTVDQFRTINLVDHFQKLLEFLIKERLIDKLEELSGS